MKRLKPILARLHNRHKTTWQKKQLPKEK
jgi:hypothetical protein